MEGARRGILPEATAAARQAATEEVLQTLATKDYSVTVLPAAMNDETAFVTVTGDIPLSDNALPMSAFVLGRTVSSTITLRRERQ